MLATAVANASRRARSPTDWIIRRGHGALMPAWLLYSIDGGNTTESNNPDAGG